MRIDDGSQTFDYRFTNVEVGKRTPLWFFEAVAAPAIDEVQIWRLHRQLLAAHCLGDAELVADLSASESVIASRGELFAETRANIRKQFAALFGRLDYTAYHDLVPPVIEVAESGDVGWIAVNAGAVGHSLDTGEPFDDRWAWVMMVRKRHNRWLHAGNTSNYAEN